MSTRKIETPPSYFEKINEEVLWSEILGKCGIKIRKKRKGYGLISFDRHLMTLCPFHTEKTPSMSFSESFGYFYCFGCGAGGCKVDFIVQLLNSSFDYNKVRAYHWFKKNYNIPLPWEKSDGKYIYR